MTEQAIIEKAKKALDALEIRYEIGSEEIIYYEDAEFILDMLEFKEQEKKEKLATYSISFEKKDPIGRLKSIFVIADRNTHKLLHVLTEHAHIPIPEELS